MQSGARPRGWGSREQLPGRHGNCDRGQEGLLEGGKGSWGRSPGVPLDTLQSAPTPLLEDAVACKRAQARQLEGEWTSLPRGASQSIILKHLQPKTLSLN